MPSKYNFEDCFNNLIELIEQQQQLIAELRAEIENIPGWGGGGGTGNGFEVYESAHLYKRYQAVIDPNTDTAYLVVPTHGGSEYTSIDVKTDCENGNLKLLGFEGQIVTFPRPPKEEEVDALPENCVVVEYNPLDTPYTSILTTDEHETNP